MTKSWRFRAVTPQTQLFLHRSISVLVSGNFRKRGPDLYKEVVRFRPIPRNPHILSLVASEGMQECSITVDCIGTAKVVQSCNPIVAFNFLFPFPTYHQHVSVNKQKVSL